MNNLPMVIGNQMKDPGYVYLVRFDYFKNCYKVGSTANVYNRMKLLRRQYGPTELIAYGFANNKLKVEKSIQWLLFNSSNLKHYHFGGVRVASHDNVGPGLSTEHLIMETPTVCNAIVLMDTLCNSVCMGSPFWEFKNDHISSYWAEALP